MNEEIVQMVDEYVSKELSDARRYENSSPLDESGVWSLHRLAAEIYRKGFDAGERVQPLREHGKHLRQLELADAAKEAKA